MPTYESHVTTSPVFASPAIITYPFIAEEDTATKIVAQPLLQLADQYAPPAIGATFNPATDANFSGSPISIGTAYCVGDTTPQPAESGLVSFSRMWSNIPATRYDYVTTSITYPGMYYTLGGVGRLSFSQVVQSQITTDYFRAGPGLAYTSAASIPLIPETRLINLYGLNNPLLSDTWLDYDGTVTIPSTETYLTWISAANYQIVVDCGIERYMGDIWARKTRRVIAK